MPTVVDRGPAPSRWRRQVRPLLLVVLAAALIGLADLVVLRTVGWHPGPTVVLVSLLPVLLLAAAPLLVLALLLRTRALAVVAVVLCLVWALLYVPELGHGPQVVPPGWTTVRVVSANLLYANDRLDEELAELAAADPDVIVLQEVTAEHEDALAASSLWSRYPERFGTARRWGLGSLVLSRLPLEDERLVEVGGRTMPVATVVTGGGPVSLVAVHATPPVIRQEVWRSELVDLAELARELDRPLLVGDFNATADHRPFRDLLDVGLTDGQRAAGTGWGATWPSGNRWVPVPVVRIDHVLTGAGLEVTSLEVGEGVGSDHRPLVAEVAVAPPG